MLCWLCCTGVGIIKTQLTRMGEHSSLSGLPTLCSCHCKKGRHKSERGIRQPHRTALAIAGIASSNSPYLR